MFSECKYKEREGPDKDVKGERTRGKRRKVNKKYIIFCTKFT
jgi:hypothetical protein